MYYEEYKQITTQLEINISLFTRSEHYVLASVQVKECSTSRKILGLVTKPCSRWHWKKKRAEQFLYFQNLEGDMNQSSTAELVQQMSSLIPWPGVAKNGKIVLGSLFSVRRRFTLYAHVWNEREWFFSSFLWV